MDVAVDLAADSLSGEITSVRSGERTYSRAISAMRSSTVADLMHPALLLRLPIASRTSPRASCSTTSLSAGSFCRMISSRRAVRSPASCNCA
jgi:hypothetical protein